MKEEDNIWTMADQANLEFLELKYQNREELGRIAIEKRKLADSKELTEDGKKNPHYPRLSMEAEIARLQFDMAYVIEQNRMLQKQIDLMSCIFNRVHILELAQAHVSNMALNVNLEYAHKFKQFLDSQK